MSFIKTVTAINHPQGAMTLQEIQNDVDEWVKHNPRTEFSFTAITVQALIDKIVELQTKLIYG